MDEYKKTTKILKEKIEARTSSTSNVDGKLKD
jgi:hypothetical protein